jgi:ABC-2 type transport system permease protein
MNSAAGGAQSRGGTFWKYMSLVALREYGENVRTKGFWIGLLLFPVMIYAGIRVPKFLADKATPTRAYCIVDRSEDLGAAVRAHMQQTETKRIESERAKWFEETKNLPEAKRKAFVEPKARFLEVPLPEGAAADDPEALKAALRPYLIGEKKVDVAGKPSELFALIVLPKDLQKRKKDVEFWSVNLADDDLENNVQRGLEDELRRREFVASGMQPEDVKRISGIEVDIDLMNPKKAAGEQEVSARDKIRQWAPAGFVYLLFVGIMTIAQMLLNNTVEEKSNRIVEVLLSSVTPTELMAGKLFGIAGVGFTMMLWWFASGALILRMSIGPGADDIAKMIFDVLFTPSLLVAFGIYFTLGYLLYAAVFLAIGSMCNTLKDAQNFMGPVMMVMMVPILTMFFIPKDPNGTLATVMSWIPLYTPFAMMNRAAADPPLFEIIGTGILLVVSVAVVLWLAGRIFRVGILRTGQPPKILELFQWLKQGE